MKKIITILSVALVLAGCNKGGLQISSVEAPDELYGAISGDRDAGTKTWFVGPITQDGKIKYPQYWELGDKISVFWNSTENILYKCFNNISNNNTVGGTIQYSAFAKTSSAAGSYADIGNNRYSVYPYDKGNKFQDGKVYFTIPATQTYREVEGKSTYGTATFKDFSGSDYTCGCSVFVSRNTEDLKKGEHYNYFNFYNVGCWLKLKIISPTEFTLGKVELTGNDGQILAGAANCTMTSKDASGYWVPGNISAGSGSSTVTLKGNGSKKIGSTATEIFLYFLPTNFFASSATNKGFTVKIYDDSDVLKGTAVCQTEPEEADGDIFQRNRVVLMSNWTLSEYIKFAVLEIEKWTNIDVNINFE